ncbi:MAG: histidine--tRNA ligase [Myxococcales bacterium]|nr:histidine--tRNA ligase [Myxococcales bacterium]
MQKLRSVKGMNDILPEQMPAWRRLEETFRATVERHGYQEMRSPIVEPTALFVRSIGEATDIVEKEMYTFTDKGDHSLTLRPEGTASCVRAYLQHSAGERSPVTKWFYMGPMFRRERPAKGRYRQFYQAGVELYGDPGPYTDAEMIDMVVSMLRDLGVLDVEVLINSLGSEGSRERYREALLAYLLPLRDSLSAESQARLERSPLRVLDSKAPEDQEIAEGAPRILDFLDEADQTHFDGLRATLDALGTPYRVEPRLVRGLDYYTRTLFEVQGRGSALGAQNALLGGGRYDAMVGELGGPSTPAIGFAMGLERILMVLPEAEAPAPIDAFVIATRPELRLEASVLARDLRREGLRIDGDLRGGSLKSQLRRADKVGARLALLLGPRELEEGLVQLKDLRDKAQQDVPRAELAALILRMLER